MRICQCKNCGRIYEYIRKKKHTLDRCNSCVAITGLRERKTKALYEAKGGAKCSQCGYDKHTSALDFHHVDPETKKFTISSSLNRSLKSLLEEIDKCVILCANCHRVAEHELSKTGKSRNRGSPPIEPQIVNILELKRQGLTNFKIAERLGCTHQNVSRIVRREVHPIEELDLLNVRYNAHAGLVGC